MNIAQRLIEKWTGVDETPKNSAKPSYLEVLKKGVHVVTFEKISDGSISTMEVTLDPNCIPTEHQLTESKTTRPEKEHLIHAFSPDRGGWRSFAIDNVKSFHPRANLMELTSNQLRINNILQFQLGLPENMVTPDKNFFEDLGADSLDWVEIILAVEDEFNIDIIDEEAESVKTVQQLYDYVEHRLKLKAR